MRGDGSGGNEEALVEFVNYVKGLSHFGTYVPIWDNFVPISKAILSPLGAPGSRPVSQWAAAGK